MVYHTGAVSIAGGHGFAYSNGEPIGFWPVGYSALIGGAYWIFGPSLRVSYVVNVILGIASIFAVHRFARWLYDERVAMLSAWITALYPTFILYTTIVASENVFIPLVVAAVYVALRAARGPGRGREVLLAGALLGLSVLVRPTAFLLPAVPLVMGLAMGNQILRSLAVTATIVLVMVLLSIPWGLRNENVFGRFNLTSFNGGINLWMGNHPGSDGRYAAIPDAYAALPIAERDAALKQTAIEFISRHPLEFVRLAVLRTGVTMRAETIASVWNSVGIERTFGSSGIFKFKIACTLGYYLVLVGAAIALAKDALAGRFAQRELVLASILIVLSLPFVVIVGQDRYHLPLVPFLIIAASSMARVEVRNEWLSQAEISEGPAFRLSKGTASVAESGAASTLKRRG
jgi:4-amino-4-deoxy-L-arabinose transferase-like glycosyltransferase